MVCLAPLSALSFLDKPIRPGAILFEREFRSHLSNCAETVKDSATDDCPDCYFGFMGRLDRAGRLRILCKIYDEIGIAPWFSLLQVRRLFVRHRCLNCLGLDEVLALKVLYIPPN